MTNDLKKMNAGRNEIKPNSKKIQKDINTKKRKRKTRVRWWNEKAKQSKAKRGNKKHKKDFTKRWVKKHPKTLNQKCSNQR